MTSVLLTGATGLVGRHVLPLLAAAGHEVHAVTSQAPPRSTPQVHWHQADLLSPAAADELASSVDASKLLHLAWYVAPGDWSATAQNLRWLEASLRLVERFAAAGGSRVVVAGSGAEYDWSHSRLDEFATPRRPASFYGVCKNALFEVLSGYAADNAVSFAWGRLFFVYGPGERRQRLVASVAHAALLGQDAPCSHGEQLRDYLYVEDAAAAFVALLDSAVEGPVNVGSGTPVAIKDLVRLVASAAGSPDVVRLGAIPAFEPDPPLLVAATERLSREVGFQPRFGLSEGVGRTVEWWRQELGDGSRDHATTGSEGRA